MDKRFMTATKILPRFIRIRGTSSPSTDKNFTAVPERKSSADFQPRTSTPEEPARGRRRTGGAASRARGDGGTRSGTGSGAPGTAAAKRKQSAARALGQDRAAVVTCAARD